MGSLSNRNLIINFTSDVLNERNIDRMFFKNIYIYICVYYRNILRFKDSCSEYF